MSKHIKIIIAILFISFILYYRLFHKRLPRDLYDDLNFYLICLYFLILVSMFVLLILNIIKLYKKVYKVKTTYKSTYLDSFLNLLNHKYNPVNLLNKSLITFDAFIKNNTPEYDSHKLYSDHIIEKISIGFSLYPKSSISVLLLLRIIPQIIICLSFLIDVLVFHKFFFLYKTLWVLLVPMLITYITYSIKKNIEINLDSLNDSVNLTVDNKQLTIYQWYDIARYDIKNDVQTVCTINLKNENLNSEKHQNILDYIIDGMNLYFTLEDYIIKYDYYREFSEYSFNIFKYLTYTICWIYILFYGVSF